MGRTWFKVPASVPGWRQHSHEKRENWMAMPNTSQCCQPDPSLGIPHIPPFWHYIIIQCATFATSAPSSNTPLPGSIMCMYTLRDIRMCFADTESILHCSSGLSNTGPTQNGGYGLSHLHDQRGTALQHPAEKARQRGSRS